MKKSWKEIKKKFAKAGNSRKKAGKKFEKGRLKKTKQSMPKE
jgi:hypothetical protein